MKFHNTSERDVQLMRNYTALFVLRNCIHAATNSAICLQNGSDCRESPKCLTEVYDKPMRYDLMSFACPLLLFAHADILLDLLARLPVGPNRRRSY